MGPGGDREATAVEFSVRLMQIFELVSDLFYGELMLAFKQPAVY